MLAIIDRALAREHLELAERHVAEGQLRVIAQLALVAKLERRGSKSRRPTRCFTSSKRLLALHVQHRDRLAQELREGV